MSMETLLWIYLAISVVSAMATGLWSIEQDIEGVDGFWDWVIYNIFWIIQPIKAIVKLIKNSAKNK